MRELNPARKIRGSSRNQLPVVMLLFFVILGLLLHRWEYPKTWNPASAGRAAIDPGSTAPVQVVIDPRGWPRLSEVMTPYVGSVPTVKDDQLLSWSGGAATVIPAPAHTTGQKVAFRFSGGGYDISGNLHQTGANPDMLLGSLEGDLSTRFYQPRGEGETLDLLSLLPLDTEKVVCIDSRGLSLPPSLLDPLLKELKRWEFDPRSVWSDVVGSPVCYARWKGDSILVIRLASREKFERELRKRFPSSVIFTTTRWAQGVRVEGFSQTKDPAWFVRGDYLVVTPVGGTDRLVDFLDSRYGESNKRRPRNPMFEELRSVTRDQERWHLCLIERSPDKPIHWTALVRWPEGPDEPAQGILLVDVQERKSEMDSASKVELP